MNRQPAIDLTRGFIMILMALDHANIFLGTIHWNEPWGLDFSYYSQVGQWFTRFVTHLCAPGFFFLMGMSMVLFTTSRQQKNWTSFQIIKYFLKRGGIIMLCMLLLEFPAWGIGLMANSSGEAAGFDLPGAVVAGEFIFPTTVLFGLGISMMVGSLLVFLKRWQLLLISILAFTLSGSYIAHLDPISVFHPFEHILLVPGVSSGISIMYPLIPWIGIVTFGMLWAKWMQQQTEKIYIYSLIVGSLLISLFLILRISEWGNFQRNEFHDFISFFTLIKYPPSIAYASFTCGINLLIFYIFSILKPSHIFGPIRLFGQTAMFFYIVHLFVFALASLVIPKGVSLPTLYSIWLIGLVPLYFLCRWFLNFKRQKAANSIWRML